MIYDLSALLWIIAWPSDKLQVYVDAFKAFIYHTVQNTNVILVFDRYFTKSITNFTRMQRARSSHVYNLTPQKHATPKQVILTNMKNKIQPNAILAEGLLDSSYYISATK